MWIFNCPKVVFGDDALEHLEELQGQRAFFVTDANMVAFGFVDRVQEHLDVAGIESDGHRVSVHVDRENRVNAPCSPKSSQTPRCRPSGAPRR